VKPALGFVTAGVLLVLALGAALLAADVRSWQRTMRADDAVLSAAPRAASWNPQTHLSSLAENVLGVSDDVRVRRALALFRENVNVRPRLDNAQQVGVARAKAEQALAAVARESGGARASQAETLLGVLVFTDVAPSINPSPFAQQAGIDPDQARASIVDFEDAVKADPGNEVAKYDLELVMRTLLAQGIRVNTGPQTGAGATGRRGAGGGVSGGGY
jgi:hypothetical protein